MKCLNPECGSLDADELNVSVNVSKCVPGVDETGGPVYEGSTEVGQELIPVGTICDECGYEIADDDTPQEVVIMLGLSYYTPPED